MRIKNNSQGVRSVAKRETITVSTRFANNLRELAYLLDDKRPLAEFLDEHCGWVLVNLVEEKAGTVGEWCDIISEIAPWDTEADCQAVVDRVRPKFEETAIFEVYQDDEGTWDIAMLDSRYAHWHTIWLHCREYGIEFEEARKAFLRVEAGIEEGSFAFGLDLFHQLRPVAAFALEDAADPSSARRQTPAFPCRRLARSSSEKVPITSVTGGGC